MTPRRIILILASLNAGLLATIFAMLLLFKEPTVQTHFGPRVRTATNTVTQVAVRKINATNLLAVLAGLQQQFNWRSLESTNYVEYIDKLRAVGCPEETIRDIIIADVGRLFGERRAVWRAQVPPFKFWETRSQIDARIGPGSTYQQQVAALDREERTLIRELLDVDLDTELAHYTGRGEIDFEEASFAPETSAKVRPVLDKYRQLEQQVLDKTRGVMMAGDEARLRELQRQRDAELAGILSPEELEEYQLRHSDTAQTMRAQLGGFEPSEDEFRRVFRLQKTFDDDIKQAFEGLDGDKVAEIRAQVMSDSQAALDEEMKETLGEQRFAEYQRAQDNDYQALLQLSDRLPGGPKLANQVYEWKVTAQRQREKVMSNPALTHEQRRAALAAIASTTASTVATAMGQENFQSYRGTYGLWLEDLAQAPPPPEPEPEPPTLPPGIFLPLPPFPPPDVNRVIRQ